MAKGTVQKALDWLLEPEDPGVRYLALRDLVPSGGKELIKAQKAAHEEGPINAILAKMEPEGYWGKPGQVYLPKYFSTVWSVITLAQLGASVKTDARAAKTCSYIMEHALIKDSLFSINGLPSGTVDCLQGNLCAALLDMGCEDPRLEKAFEWMARALTGEGIAPVEDKTAAVRYYAGKCGPNFACGANNKLPCAWGGAKVMLAFSKLPQSKRTPLIEKAIKTGVDFFFSKDPVKADYPSGYSAKPSGNWWKFGFPVFYITDILQIAEGLTGLGYGKDPRLANTLNFIREKQDAQGRWALEYDYNGKTWVDFGKKKQPSKWVTLRALRVLGKVTNDK
ncbi:MAG TPA: nitrogen fixation protein NifH [Dehalococcoidales bacterium]|nr:nitrogen fixation protein NifH [Dehalococcoidales bacterium]